MPDEPITPAPAAEAPVTVRVPGTVATFWERVKPDMGSELSAIERDIAAAWVTGEERPHGKNGTVHILTTTRTIAEAFLASLATVCDSEYDADNADTRAATAGLMMIQRYAKQGLEALAPGGDYRMRDPKAQARLEVDIADRDAKEARTAARRAEAAPYREAWAALSKQERAERTQAVLSAVAPVLGLQHDGRAWLDLGNNVMATVPDGRLYLEVRRIADPAARPGLHAARETLTAAGWAITDGGSYFYAVQPAA